MTSRRQFLRTSLYGAGALSLTPSLLASEANIARNGFPKRFIFLRKSNGLRPLEVALPTFSAKEKQMDERKEAMEVDLDRHELPVWLGELSAHKENMTILQGLSAMMSRNGHSSGSSVMGAFNDRGSIGGIKRATIDFELAKLFPSPFGHVELSLAGGNGGFQQGVVSGLSAPGAYQRNYCYADPETAYNELFKSVTDPSALRSENSMLSFLGNEDRLRSEALHGIEKLKLSNHVNSIEAIRNRNQALSGFSGRISENLPELDKVHLDGGKNATLMQKYDAMVDIMTCALINGLTNVVTYTLDTLGTPVTGLPGNEGDRISIHEVGHGGGYSGVNAEQIREKMRICHMRQINKIVERLKATPEGKGTMFDNTLIMYFPENGESHHSIGSEAPFILLAGSNCSLNLPGRYIRLPYHATQGHQTLGNWYTTLLNAHGNPIKHYGDLDLEMARKKMPQTGPIQQFLG